MKIVFTIPSLGKGGAERVVSNLANYLVGKKHSVAIVVNNAKNVSYDIDKKVQIIELDDKNKRNPISKNLRRINKIIQYSNKSKPDVIISFLPMPSFRVLYIKEKINCKIIVSDRNNPKIEYGKFPNNLLMKKLYKKADGFVFQTEQQKSYFSKQIQNKSVIIANPLKEEFLKVKSVDKKENTIITVGRLVNQKNHKLLIDAFNEIKNKYKDYKLKIVGEGPLKSELNDYIDKLNLKNQVELCGVVDNISELLVKSKLFVLSSDYEGMPNALMEAMACGMACISTNCPCGGPDFLIDNNQNGILVDVKDKDEMVKAIDNVLSNEKLMIKLGQNAQLISKNLNPMKINKEWEEYIERVVKDENTY